MSDDDKDYFRRRAEQEMEAAERASGTVSADIHRSLAARMLALAAGSPVSEPKDLPVAAQAGDRAQ